MTASPRVPKAPIRGFFYGRAIKVIDGILNIAAVGLHHLRMYLEERR